MGLTSCDGPLVEAESQGSSVHRLYDASNKIATSNSGREYRIECEDAGVPVPRSLIDETDGWVNRGAIFTEFLSSALEAELWTWEIDAGICMALPRWDPDDDARLFGLICFSYDTGNTCFWDNKKDDFLSRYQAHSIDDLIGGAALEGNQQGVCTNCHAGENPFVVDPDEIAFAWVTGISGDNWPTPIVHEDWIGNPGPISSLGPVPTGQGKCTECHNEASGMRFPLVLEEHTGANTYCDKVLGFTIAKSEGAPAASMPPDYASTSSMNVQAERFWDYCEAGPPPDYAEEVDFDPPEPSVLSPLDLGPYYECAQTVSVRNAVPGATVELKTDTQGPFTALATGSTVVFELEKSLDNLENVYAEQSLNGITSPSVFERAHTYPDDLPAPAFLYTPLYACASSVAINNVPGATLVVEHIRNDSTVQEVEFSTFAEYSSVVLEGDPAESPETRFDKGDVLVARQRLCKTSPKSPNELVEPFTENMETPTIRTLREGQATLTASQLVQGGSLHVFRNAELMNGVSSNPATSRHLGLLIGAGVNEPLQKGDDILLAHRLCDEPVWAQTEVIECDPASLAPDLLPAFEGNDFIVVEDGILGATVNVYAEGLSHIGTGAGSEVNLIRGLVKDEKIWVTQSLPGCKPTTATKLTVL